MRPKKAFRIASLALTGGFRDLRLARDAIEAGALQRTWELAALTGIVRRLRPSTIIEIGTYRGGTLRCWARVAADNAHFICIDALALPGAIGATDRDRSDLRALLGPGHRLTFLPMDSGAAATAEAVESALAGTLVDFLYVDGDHAAGAVRRDFELYAPRVRPGGVIAIHDIHPNPDMPSTQVHGFWRELKAKYPWREFIDQDFTGGVGTGIGVLLPRHRISG